MSSAKYGIEYSSFVFIDTMLVLEGPPLTNQPWHEVDKSGPILIVVVPQVQAEIDKRKRDGRLAERARAFNRLIGPAVTEQRPVRISDRSPAVDIILADCERVDYDALDLDRDEGDHRVVGQMLNAKHIDLARSVLISHDINPIAVALSHGLDTKHLPDHWLLSPEPSPKDKENARLKAENKELKKTQPELKVSVDVSLPDQFELLHVGPLTENDHSDVFACIEGRYDLYPRRASNRYDILTLPGSEPSERELEKYREETIPAYIANLADTLQSNHNQLSFKISIENIGPVTATQLVVEVSVSGGRFDSVFHAGLYRPPSPPKGKGLYPFATFENLDLGRHMRNLNRSDHELFWGDEPDRTGYGELHCREYRQGRKDNVEAFVEFEPSATSEIAIRVTASNLNGHIQALWTETFNVREAVYSEIVDKSNFSLIMPFPMRDRLMAATKSEQTDWVEFQ